MGGVEALFTVGVGLLVGPLKVLVDVLSEGNNVLGTPVVRGVGRRFVGGVFVGDFIAAALFWAFRREMRRY